MRRLMLNSVLLWCVAATACVSAMVAQTPVMEMSPMGAVVEMAKREAAATEHRSHFTYLQFERSERTGGKLWEERAVETEQGKATFLLREDGKPIGPERERQERGRLQNILNHPEEFAKKEEARRKDEAHAKQMLQLLPKAFLFDGMTMDGKYIRVNYRPNPDYKPASMEEKILHGMKGFVLIDPAAMRMHYLEGHMDDDVTFGFGVLGTVHAGSTFKTTRDAMSVGGWKTTAVETHIDGKILLFKTLSRNLKSARTEIVPVADNLTLAQAVAMAEQGK